METAICVVLTALLAMPSGYGVGTYLRNKDTKPPTWERIVAALGESLNLANKRIESLENKIERMQEHAVECEKTNAVLLDRIERMERVGEKEAT